MIKLLPDPRKLTKYVAPQPIPKPRTQKSRPVPIPRSDLYPKPIAAKVKKIIDEITPYYKPEAIREFQKNLRDNNSNSNRQ